MTSPFNRPKLTTQQVGAAGEHFVAAEVHRRGGYAVTFSGNMRDIDLLASDAAHDRVIKCQCDVSAVPRNAPRHASASPASSLRRC